MLKDIKLHAKYFIKNRKRLAKQFLSRSICIVPSAIAKNKNSDIFYPFRQDSNFFYLTGTELQRSILVIIKQENALKTIIFTPNQGYNTSSSLCFIQKQSGVDQVQDINQLGNFYHDYFDKKKFKYVYINDEPQKDIIVPSYSIILAMKLKTYFPNLIFKPYKAAINDLRRKKQPYEIRLLKRAINITEITLKKILPKITIGMSEYQVKGLLEYYYSSFGISSSAFQHIVATGANTLIMHYSNKGKILKKNDFLLIDSGAEYKNYGADITRTVPVKGKFSKNQIKYYEIVKKASREVIKSIKIGISWKELQNISTEYLYQGLKDLGIIDKKEKMDQIFPHAIGHFIGLDTHDVSTENHTLQKGDIIAIEPGIYLKNKGFGIRLEDNILIKEDGYENLSRKIPIEIAEIEYIMQNINPKNIKNAIS